jgi:hypothetical protein
MLNDNKEMNNLTLALNTLTNGFALLPLQSCFRKKDYFGTGIIFVSFCASVMMHVTETKHNLIPPFLREYSNIFLNADRTAALAVALYGGYLTYNAYSSGTLTLALFRPILLKFAVGTIALGIGEIASNLVVYNVFHTIWHYCAFTALDDVISL